jgi:hypothetical protein
MSEEVKNKEPAFFPLPYPLVVENENSVRQKIDFWRLRTLAIVMRQPPNEIKKFESRYDKALNQE